MKNFKKVLSILTILIVVFTFVYTNVNAEVQYTSDLCTDSSKASASDSYNGRGPEHLFDNLNSDCYSNAWESNTSTTPHWVKYDFGMGNEKKIEKYTLSASGPQTDVAANDTPKSFKFQGSNDNTNWIDLDIRTSETGWTNFLKREYTFTNSNSYRYYRLYIDAINGGNGWYAAIGEMEMMEKVQTSPPAPSNLVATAGNSKVDLSWAPSAGATSYNIKRSMASGQETTLASGITTTTYTDTAVSNGITYYYVVTAVNSAGESPKSNEESATPRDSSIFQGNKAILVIAMMNGNIKEYDMTISEINLFLMWYDNKENGVAGIKSYYAIKKNYNVKPFFNRIDYIVFSKIQDFEIKDYND